MGARREILDSEDEGSVFGDDQEFPDTAPQHDEDPSPNAGTDSTDPFFFQRVYHEQHAAAGASSIIPDTAPAGPSASTYTDLSSAPPPGQKPPPETFSSLTPVTDPVSASRRSKRARDVLQSEVIDLTDITTPRMETASGASDVWDLPSSTGSQRTTRTHGKRQRAEQQLTLQQEAPCPFPPTQDPYDFPEATPPTRKKTKRGSPSSSAQQTQESSPVMLVPTAEMVSSDRRSTTSRGKDGGSRPGSTMADAGASLYVAQSTLTASQKQQYKMVNLSSEAGFEVPETSLPMSFLDEGGICNSSGTTTIAYPTPSRAAGLARLVPFEGMEGVEVSGVLFEDDIQHQQSSPDVLTDMSATGHTRSKKTRIKVVASSNIDSSDMCPPSSARTTKKRKVVQDEDDEWNHTPSDGAQGSNTSARQEAPGIEEAGDITVPAVPLDSDTNCQPATAPEPEIIDFDSIESPTAPTPKPTQKKKPGRKKKGTKPKEATPPADANSEPIPGPADVPEPPAKRKRGRPRKSEAKKPTPADEPASDTVKDVQADVADDASLPQPLSEVPHNLQPSGHSKFDTTAGTDRDDGVGTKENKGDSPPVVAEAEAKGNDSKATSTTKEKEKRKENEKPGATTQSQKVQYRVGLSKRSRIAPLLKSLKKPT